MHENLEARKRCDTRVMIHNGGMILHRVGGAACPTMPLWNLITDHFLVYQLCTWTWASQSNNCAFWLTVYIISIWQTAVNRKVTSILYFHDKNRNLCICWSVVIVSSSYLINQITLQFNKYLSLSFMCNENKCCNKIDCSIYCTCADVCNKINAATILQALAVLQHARKYQND